MIKKILLFLLLLFQAGCTFNNTEHLMALEKEANKHASHEGTIYRDLVYKSTLFHDIALDIYEPLIKKYKKAPIYIYIHGGSWLHGNKALVNVYYKTVQKLREEGIAVVSIDYRYISQSGVEAIVSDCLDAVSFLQKNADKYALDPHFIGIHGHSAGANLALLTGFNDSKKGNDIRFIVDEYGPTNVVKLLKEKEDRPFWTYFISDNTLNKLSPIEMIHKNIPPVYIVHGGSDHTVPIEQSQQLYKQLKENGTEVYFQTVVGADHGYRGADQEEVAKIREEVLAFMLKKFAGTLGLDEMPLR